MTAVSEKASQGSLESQRGSLPTALVHDKLVVNSCTLAASMYVGRKAGHLNLASRHPGSTANNGLLCPVTVICTGKGSLSH